MITEQKFDVPDYAVLRDQAGFEGGAFIAFYLAMEALEINYQDFNLDPKAAIKVFTEGRKLVEDLYGPEFKMSNPCTPPISYGHLSCLGVDLVFPENGEVHCPHKYADSDLQEIIDLLRKPVDFASSGLAPFYMDYHSRLQKEFPGENVNFSYKKEGMVTTAYLLRGDRFFTDIFDEPEKIKELFDAIVDSTLEFEMFLRRYRGQPLENKTGGGFADDIAAMIPPYLYDELVLPYWEKLLCGLTSGKRSAHVEDLQKDHLPYLEKINLSKYDPSVSPKINPRIISENCRIPFDWRLFNFHFNIMDIEEVRDWVYMSAADGASCIIGVVSDGMLNKQSVEKAHVFRNAMLDAKEHINTGGDREKLREKVSSRGKKKFWENWPE